MKCVVLLALAVFPFTPILAGPTASPAPAAADVQLVAPEKLAPILPAAPQGWSTAEPKLLKKSKEDTKTVSAVREYTNEAPDAVQSVTITIADWGVNNPEIKKNIEAFRTENASDDDGFIKPVNLQGFPGQMEADFNTKVNKITYIVADRYYVEFSFLGLAPEEMEAWPKRIDLKKLAEIK